MRPIYNDELLHRDNGGVKIQKSKTDVKKQTPDEDKPSNIKPNANIGSMMVSKMLSNIGSLMLNKN
jgi:hypothetical protein